MGQMPQGGAGNPSGAQAAALNAMHGSEAAKPVDIAPKQGAELSQAPQQHAAPAAQTNTAPPPAQHAAPPQAPPAQTVQSSSSATTPMSPGIREGTTPLHQQPASTGYQAVSPQAPAAPPPAGPAWRPGDLGRTDPISGTHVAPQQPNNPVPVPARTPVFSWHDKERQQKHLSADVSGAPWWGDAVQYFLTGWLLRGNESEQGKLAFAPLLEPAPEGQLLRKLADGMPELEWAFLLGDHATNGPTWYWFTNQGPMLAPLRGKGVPSASRGSLEAWPDYAQGLVAFGRSRTAAEAAVEFADGLLKGGVLRQARAVVTTEQMGAELRGRALGLNTSAQAGAGDGHLDHMVVLDQKAARYAVPGFAEGKTIPVSLQLTHPLASSNPALFLRLERLASLWTDKGETPTAPLPIPAWRMAGLAHLATRWVLMALGSTPGNWSDEHPGWAPVASAVRESLSATQPGYPPNPDLASKLGAFDQAAQSYAVLTLRQSNSWLIGDLHSVDPKMREAIAGQLEDPAQRDLQLKSLAATNFDNAWRVVLAWEATRLATGQIWRQQGPDVNTQWLFDLGYLMHKLYNGDLRNQRHPAYDAQGALDRFEAWANQYDPYNPTPMPNLV